MAMDRPTATPLQIGAWSVDPATDQIARDGEAVKLESRTMRLLLCLAERAGATVSTDELMERVWPATIAKALDMGPHSTSNSRSF